MKEQGIRTQKEKDQAVQALTAEMNSLGDRTFFGDSNFTAYGAAVKVIQEDLQVDQIEANWEGDEYTITLAWGARDWLDGSIPLSELVDPENIPPAQ